MKIETAKNRSNNLDTGVKAGFDSAREVLSIDALIRLRISQCGALLRQQLEHKAKQEPKIYSRARIGHVTRMFRATSVELYSSITERVRTRVTEYVQEEIHQVLKDAITEGATSLVDPIWSNFQKNLLNTIDVEPNPGQEEQGLKVKELDNSNGSFTQAPEGHQEDPHNAPTKVQKNSEHSEGLLITSESTPSSGTGPLPQYQTRELQMMNLGIPQEEEEVICQGTVRLQVEPTGSVPQLMAFIDALRHESDFRLMKLVGTAKEGVGIWLGLRSPIPLVGTLLQMNEVSHVKEIDHPDGNDKEFSFSVKLDQGLSTA